MRGVRSIACALAVIALFVVPNARADEYTKLTYLTFSGPVQLPGVTLPGGTYMFKLADPDSGRRILQVWDKEGTKLYTTLMTIPDERMQATDEPAVMFSERPSGQAAAIKSWFYPAERIGYEFVYPKRQAMQIAKDTHSSVLSYNDESAKNDDAAAMRSAKVGRIDENGQAVEDNNKAADNRSNTGDHAASTTANNNANNNNSDNSATTAQSASVNRAPAAATTAADNDDAASTTATRAGARTPQSTTAQSTSGQSSTAGATQAASANPTQSSTVGTTGTASSTTAPARAGSTAVGTTGTANPNTNNVNSNNRQSNTANSNRPSQSDRGSNAAAPRSTLPKTASPLTTIELLSALTLAGAFGVRGLRKRGAENRV